jgi:pyruvate kinase
MAERTENTVLSRFRRTKIVATIGPASGEKETLRRLVDAGVDVMRLNFSHGDHAEKATMIARIREVEAEGGRPVAILQDLQGPKIRVGAIAEPPLRLAPGDRLEIRADAGTGARGHISTNYPTLAREVATGDAVFLDDGAIELRVAGTDGATVICEVITGGEVNPGKGVNLPDTRLKVETLTEKDREDLRFGLAHGVDCVALSFVRRPEDAAVARKAMQASGRRVPLIAKVEKREAVERMASVLRAFDGAMVARGDLGAELRPEVVPGVQKKLIAAAGRLGRPVITATQMLESMTTKLRPTRAEASDVANAVIDGTHAVMLSGETAIGRHPVEVVEAMSRIVLEAERFEERMPHAALPARSVAAAVCQSAATLAEQAGATALVAFTRSGRTARTLSGLQPDIPILALCDTLETARLLCLWRGVMPLVTGATPAGESPADTIGRELSRRNLLPKGSRLVTVGAAPGTPPGQTNFIRLLRL